MHRARCLVVLVILGVATPWVRGQDFILPYNKSPETAAEFWAACKYELGLGNHQRVAEMLSRFQDRLAALGADEQNKLLLAIYDRDGLSPLLRMANLDAVRKTKIKDPATEQEAPVADVLVRRITKAIEDRAGDPGRIEFFVNNLSKSAEERTYAFTQLRMAGARAVPYMVAVLRNQARQREHEQIIAALVRMDSGMGPALLAALDAGDAYLALVIFTVFQRRADDRIVPHLWWFSTAAVPPELKAAAQGLLARFRPGQQINTRAAVAALTAVSERFYKHEEQVLEPATIWKWDPQQGVVSVPASASEYEEHYGTYWAKKALSLDPAARDAQVLLVSLALEKALERGGVEAPLASSAPHVAHLLAGTSTQLLEKVLSRAMAEKRVAVVLGSVRALGAAGEARLLRDQEGTTPPLVRALAYPDVRVQMAAAEAILHIPTPEGYAGASRVVRVLSRALDGDGAPRVLIAAGQRETAQKLAALFKQMGFDATPFTTGSDLIRQASATSDLALIVLDVSLGDNDLPYTLSQLRSAADTSAAPIVLTGAENQTRRLNQLAGTQPRLRVLTPTPVTADLFKAEIEPLIKDQFQPALSDAERKAQGPKALDLLLRIARGEVSGYDLRPAEPALLKALNSDELAPTAAAVLAYRPGQSQQRALADLALREVRTPAVRTAAALALRSHLQRFGVLLSPEQIKGLIELAAKVDDAALREQALRLMAFLQPSAQVEGNRLLNYSPAAKPKEAPKSDETKPEEKKSDGDGQS